MYSKKVGRIIDDDPRKYGITMWKKLKTGCNILLIYTKQFRVELDWAPGIINNQCFKYEFDKIPSFLWKFMVIVITLLA